MDGSPNDDFYFFYDELGVEVEIAASTAASHDTGLSALSAAPATLSPAFATATKAYTGTVAHTVGQVTVSATPSDSNAHAIGYYDANDAEITDASDTVAGMQVALVYGANVIKVRVTAEDRSTTEDYTITVTRQQPNDATLSALAVNPGTITPSFAPSRTDYRASLAADVARITLAATPNDAGATFVILDRDDNELSDADATTPNTFEVDVAEGDNTFKVRVTAADTTTTRTYTLIVTRASDKPVASVTAAAATRVEGDELTFTVRLSKAHTSGIIVDLDVSEDGDMVAATDEGMQRVIITAGNTSATLTVPTEGGATELDYEQHSTVTVTIEPSQANQYTISATQGSADKVVNDDDFPDAEAALSLVESAVDEGRPVMVKVTLTTAAGEQPHADSGFLAIATADIAGGATAGRDYTAVSNRRFNLREAQFSRVADEDENPDNDRWQAEYTTTVNTTNDGDPEAAETFNVVLTADTTSTYGDRLTVTGSRRRRRSGRATSCR